MVNLNKCIGSCSIINDVSARTCIPSKTEDVNLNVFNMYQEKTNMKH